MIVTLFIIVLAFAAFTYTKSEWAIIVLAAALPTYGIRFSVIGIPTTLLEVLIWSAAVGWFARMWHDRGMPHVPRVRQAMSEANAFSPYLIPIFLWIIVSLIALAISPVPIAALGLWKAYFLDALMAFALFVVVLKNKPERKYLVSALGFTLVLISLLAWYQRLTGQLLPAPWATNRPLRVTSWYSYPNAIGLFLAPIIAMYFTWFLKLLRTPSKWVHEVLLKVVVLVLGLGAIIFAVSKGAWIGVAAGCFVGALIVYREYWRRVLLLGVGIAAAVLIVPQVRTRVLDEFLFQSPSGMIRRVVWEESIAMLKDHPITGAGLDGYQTALVPYHVWWRHDISKYKLEIFLFPHNIILNFWSELGAGGVIVFIWFMIVFFRLAWSKRGQTLSVMAIAGMTALIVHGLVDVPYFKNDLAVLFWIIMALPLLDPTIHVAHRDTKWFDMMINGKKTVEARLYDEKRRRYVVGDHVKIFSRPDSREMVVEVTDLHRAPSFETLLTSHSPSDFGFSSVEHGLNEIGTYYDENDEQQNGVVGIRVRVIALPENTLS